MTRQEARVQEKAVKRRWRNAQIAERKYERQLVSVARQVGAIVDGFITRGLQTASIEDLDQALARYADLLTPWGQHVTRRMHREVAWRELRAWSQTNPAVAATLRQELSQGPVARAFSALMAEQVDLIRSIPLKAAERVHERTREALIAGQRMETLIDEIMESGDVAESRARLIARTETARTASVLTQVRSEQVGATHYRWLTAHDEAVRPDHRKLEGKIFAWAEPPIADSKSGARAHPGQIYNCRCVPIPLIPAASI